MKKIEEKTGGRMTMPMLCHCPPQLTSRVTQARRSFEDHREHVDLCRELSNSEKHSLLVSHSVQAANEEGSL